MAINQIRLVAWANDDERQTFLHVRLQFLRAFLGDLFGPLVHFPIPHRELRGAKPRDGHLTEAFGGEDRIVRHHVARYDQRGAPDHDQKCCREGATPGHTMTTPMGIRPARDQNLWHRMHSSPVRIIIRPLLPIALVALERNDFADVIKRQVERGLTKLLDELARVRFVSSGYQLVMNRQALPRQRLAFLPAPCWHWCWRPSSRAAARPSSGW